MKDYFKSPILEIFLVQIIIYLALWLSDNFLATYVTLVLTGVFAAILLISLIAEWLSETKPVPPKYFHLLIVTIIAPILSALVALFIIGIEFGI